MNIILMLIGVVLVYFVIIIIYHKNWDKGLLIDVRFDSNHAVSGDTINLVEVISNAKMLPLPYLHTKFEIDRNFVFKEDDSNSQVTDKTYRNDVFSLIFNQRVTRKIPVVCSRRGLYTISNVETVFSGVFMNEIMVLKTPMKSSIIVYPLAASSDRLSVYHNRLQKEAERRKYLIEDRFVFAGIRDYQTYDSMRDINWKASARTSHLMVNHFNETVSKNVCILLNVEPDGMLRYDEVSEAAISIASGLAQMLLASGANVSVFSNGCDIETKKPLFLEQGCGLLHLRQINTALARLDLDIEPEEYADMLQREFLDRKSGRYGNYLSDAVVIISASRREKLQRVVTEILSRQQDKMWIVPHLSGMEYGLEFCGFEPTEWVVS